MMSFVPGLTNTNDQRATFHPIYGGRLQLLLENLDAAADAARGFSLLMPGRVAKAIAEHRAAHPCHR